MTSTSAPAPTSSSSGRRTGSRCSAASTATSGVESPPSGYAGSKAAYLDEIEFIPVPDEAARVAGLQSGEYHYLEEIIPDQIEAIGDDPDVNIQILPPRSYGIIVLNNAAGLMSNVTMRQAVQAAIAVVPSGQATHGEGFFEPGPGIMLPQTAWHSEVSAELYDQGDPEKARQLLTEAGYDGTPMRILCTQEDLGDYNAAVVAQQQLEEAGFTIELEVTDEATLEENIEDDNRWDMTTNAYVFRPDPVLIPAFASCTFDGKWCSDEKDAIVDAAPDRDRPSRLASRPSRSCSGSGTGMRPRSSWSTTTASRRSRRGSRTSSKRRTSRSSPSSRTAGSRRDNPGDGERGGAGAAPARRLRRDLVAGMLRRAIAGPETERDTVSRRRRTVVPDAAIGNRASRRPRVIAFIVRRLLLLVPVLLIVGVIVFSLLHLAPGDPASMMLGREATLEQKEALREQLGLNEPLPVQFVDWFWGVLQLDFGESLFIGKPVTEALLERVQPTVLLALYSLTLSIVIAIPAGVIAAVRPNSLLDRLLMILSISGAAIPGFFFSILLILLFAVILDWLPSGGYVDLGDDPVEHLKYMILPAVALGFSGAGFLARIVRSTMLDVLNEDYVRTAYAKGLPQRHVVLGHALRNALIPVMTVIGILLASLLGGAVVIETVFNIPGMGRLLVQSVTRRDFPVVQGAVMTIAAVEVLVMLLVDVLYVFVDPRIRYGAK